MNRIAPPIADLQTHISTLVALKKEIVEYLYVELEFTDQTL